MLFRRDRIVLSELEGLERFDTQLDSARRALFGPNTSGYPHGRFLRDFFDGAPRLFADFFFRHDALQISAPIADDRKLQLTGRPFVVQPAVDGDLLADMLRKVLDARRHKRNGL